MQILNLKFLFTLLVFCSSVMAANLKPFDSDGCTMSPDGTFEHPNLWRECCVEHDLWFWGGGTNDQRILADKNLKMCILSKSNQFISTVYMWGVALGRLSPIKLTDKQWGNGWLDKNDRYLKLTPEEIALLLKQLNQLDLNLSIISKYRSYLLLL